MNNNQFEQEEEKKVEYSINPQTEYGDDDNDDMQSVIPEPEHIDVSDYVYREIFLMMRYQLSNDQVFANNLQLLNTILKNIVADPTNKKFQKLRLSNEKIKKAV